MANEVLFNYGALLAVILFLMIDKFVMMRSMGRMIADLSNKVIAKDATEYIAYSRPNDYVEPKPDVEPARSKCRTM